MSADNKEEIPLKNTKSGDRSICMDDDDYAEPQKETKFTCSYVWSYFSISGQEKVKRKKISKENFVLPAEVKPFLVAKYNPSRVAEYWNNVYFEQKLCTTMFKSFSRGLIQKLLPATVLYLAVYYIFSRFLAHSIICNQSVAPQSTTCNNTAAVAQIKELKNIERDFSRILTFFIGFFVSVSMKNYFDQVKLIPRFDTLTMGLDTFLWVDPTQKQEDVTVKGDYSAKDLRVTILRYCFLSFTMCVSRFSPKVNSYFRDPITYNNKRLLYKREFEELRRGTGDDTDLWLDKWAMPLLWANKLANDLANKKVDEEKIKKDGNFKLKDIKEGITTNVRKFQLNLACINSYSKYLLPPQIMQILVLAIYAFLIISAVSNQDAYDYSESISHQSNQTRTSYQTLEMLVLQFPLFTLMKYLMLFGWLKTAADLQLPFGSHR